MKKIAIILILSLITVSCCREVSEETARYACTPAEVVLLPYQKGGKIPFVHSQGYVFEFEVVDDEQKWNVFDYFCEWDCCGKDYYSYQTKKWVLTSAYPKFTIECAISAGEPGKRLRKFMDIAVNHAYIYHFPYDSAANFICDSAINAICFDSVMLGNKMYYEVIKKDIDSYYANTDSSMLVPASIYLNHSGIIQLTMSNNETYTRNE